MIHRRVLPLVLLVLPLLAGSLLVACTEPAPEGAASEEIPPPPSVRSDEGVPAQVVRLSDEQAATLNIRTHTMRRDEVAYTIALPGTVSPAPENFAQVSAPISGRVVEIYAHEGEPVRQGQALLAIESLEFANLAADYLQAKAEEVYQQRQVERLETLVEKKIAPSSRLDRAEADLSRASASVSATYARLRALGITDTQLDAWSAASRERPLLPLYAPIGGIIDQHGIDLGQSVEAYQEMMTIVNPAKVLVRGFVSPEDAPLLRAGDPVTITLKEMPEREITAAVTTVSPTVDPENRSVIVNVIAQTVDRWPVPGQTVRLEIRASNPKPVMTMPLSAVQYEGEQATVFVRTEALAFEKRPVTIERFTEDEVIVADGLSEGEEVAVSQVFSLKALGRYEQYAE